MSKTVSEPDRVPLLPPLASLLAVALQVALLDLIYNLLDIQSMKAGDPALIWLTNGWIIGVLLLAPRRQWAAYLCAEFFIYLAVNMARADVWQSAAYFSLCDLVETALTALAMHAAVLGKPDLADSRQLRGFVLYGLVAAPAVTSLLAGCYLTLHWHMPYWGSVGSWFTSDTIGVATVTPLYLALRSGGTFSRRPFTETAGLFALLGAVSVGVFRYSSYPTLWLVLLCLLLVGMRLGFTCSALGLLLITLAGGAYTLQGYGPLGGAAHGAAPGPVLDRVLVFQGFVALSMFAIYVTEAVQAARRRSVLRIKESEARFRSLAEASRDVIILADLDGRRKYVSPAIREMLGWDPHEVLGYNYRRVVHPDDVDKIRKVLEDPFCRSAAQLTYRARRKDGAYRWVEATSRVLRDEQDGAPTGFVYVVRDVSERKAAEEEMQLARLNAEQMAMTDGLTGLPNRRVLDQTLERAWLNGQREGTPLSVVMIDVDRFKLFNDTYGHQAGDDCLRRVAEALKAAVGRPLDLAARYGGEEFAVVLPNTPLESAAGIAESIRARIEGLCIPHAHGCGGTVTASLGCATAVPDGGGDPESLVQAADSALYVAKQGGRNRIEVAPDGLLVL